MNIKNQLVSKTAQIIIYIKNNPNQNLKKISKELDIDYNFVSKIVKSCEKEALTEIETVTREKKTVLTEKGKKIATLISQIEKIIN